MSGLGAMLADHWMTLPLLVPLLGGFVSALLPGKWLGVRRAFASAVLFATVGVALYTVSHAASGEVFVYELSGWSAPFGIALMVDRLNAALIATVSVLGLLAHLYAIQGDDQRNDYFHFLFLVQVAGLNGAFLTGDLFNLFVFFEVLLIASYNLMVFGGGESRTAAGIHYVVINLIGSALFLIGIGLLYGLTGTLNMVDLRLALTTLSAGDVALARTAGLLLMVVFGLKSAIFPLYFWLPRAYGSATAPVAALFAVMTKVGLYAIIRTTTVVFGMSAPTGGGMAAGVVSNITAPWLTTVAIVTMLLGALGVAASRRLQRMVAYYVIVSVGTILVPIAVGTVDGIAAALYYLIHSTFITAALFLIADIVSRLRGDAGDRLDEGPALTDPTWLALAYFVAAIVVVGLPPTSGFVGKMLVLESVAGMPAWGWSWFAILVASLLGIVAFALAGSTLFWETEDDRIRGSLNQPGRAMAPLLMLAVGAGLTVFAGPAYEYTRGAAEQLVLNTSDYEEAVDPATFDFSDMESHGKHGKDDGH